MPHWACASTERPRRNWRTLPPREKTRRDPRAILLRGILDDIYSRPDVAAYPYFHYRGLLCGIRAQGIRADVPFGKVADDLVACQKVHGTDKSEPMSECVFAAMEKHL